MKWAAFNQLISGVAVQVYIETILFWKYEGKRSLKKSFASWPFCKTKLLPSFISEKSHSILCQRGEIFYTFRYLISQPFRGPYAKVSDQLRLCDFSVYFQTCNTSQVSETFTYFADFIPQITYFLWNSAFLYKNVCNGPYNSGMCATGYNVAI